jgi:hypothetical protein
MAVIATAFLLIAPLAETSSTSASTPQTSLQLNVVYRCNGERLIVSRCLSEASDAYCSVSYPSRKSAATGGLTPELAERRGDFDIE